MNGALIIDKRAGLTSHDVVARVRKVMKERRVGHTGTLDPFATGVLVILVGRATRLAQFLSGAEKEYAAVIRLGYQTDTGDLTGTRVEGDFATETRRITEFHSDEIEAAMTGLRGEIDQTPPMYSAKKIGGRKLYELARRGEETERQAVRVNVSTFELTSKTETVHIPLEGTADLSVRVVCSAGTYIRTLAEDFGKRLGIGAHLAELRRTRAGSFKVVDAVSLERLAELAANDSIEQVLIWPDRALAHLPSTDLDSEQVRRVLNGIDISIDQVKAAVASQPLRLRDANGNLIAVGIYDEAQNSIHPQVVIGSESSVE